MSVMARCVTVLLLLALASSSSSAAPAEPVVLTAEEQQWIKAHPVLRVGVFGDLIPFEYLSDGVLRGVSSHYLKFVTRATGLEFTYVPSLTVTERNAMLLHGQVDLLSTYFRFDGAPPSSEWVLFPYHSSSPIIVTRVDNPGVFEIEQLQGKTVVVPDVEFYETMFRRKAIKATLIKSSSPLDMLNLLKDGRADAVIASGTFLMPYLYGQFQGVLATSGVVGGEQLYVSMAVAPGQELLFSILDKALASVTMEQREDIYRQWYERLDVDVPSISSITEHYFHALMLCLVMLLSLCALVYVSHHQRRQSVRNEEEKNLFLAVMSHEIRSPMNALLAAMELLGHTQLNAQQRHFVQLTSSGANVLLRLLDDVLDVSKLEAGHLRLEVGATDVAALVQGVVGLHRLRAVKKHLELNLSLQGPLPLLRLDSTRLAQILHNLLSNAIKFTEAGHVDIDVRLEALETGAQQLQIEVRDTGIGISEAVQATLFRAYAQDSHSYRRSGGTGLGLVICQQLVSLMSGTLQLNSEWGRGTRVSIGLPVQLALEGEGALVDNASPQLEPSALADDLQPVVQDTPANQEVEPGLSAPGAAALSEDKAGDMPGDMGRLIRAMALADRHDALQAARRVHGAALARQWLTLASACKTLDSLLQADTCWDDPACVQALTALIEHWHAASGAQPVEVLASGRLHRLEPL